MSAVIIPFPIQHLPDEPGVEKDAPLAAVVTAGVWAALYGLLAGLRKPEPGRGG